LFGGGLVGIFLAKPLTGDFSVFSCCTGFVTLNVDFLKLFHKPENEIKIKQGIVGFTLYPCSMDNLWLHPYKVKLDYKIHSSPVRTKYHVKI